MDAAYAIGVKNLDDGIVSHTEGAGDVDGVQKAGGDLLVEGLWKSCEPAVMDRGYGRGQVLRDVLSVMTES